MDIFVYDSVSASEIFGDGNIMQYDLIAILESVVLYVPPDFGNFLRGRPFIEIHQSKVDSIDLGGGYAQIIDRWGRTKMMFEIIIPISHKSEILAYRTHFRNNYNGVFYFTNPIDSVRYNVKFVGDQFRIEQIAANTYQGKVILVEHL